MAWLCRYNRINSFHRAKNPLETVHFSLKDNLPAVFILVIFFFQWLVYIFISRITFIYHFYSDVPFLCLGSAFIINKYWSNKWAKILTIAYFALVSGIICSFLPSYFRRAHINLVY